MLVCHSHSRLFLSIGELIGSLYARLKPQSLRKCENEPPFQDCGSDIVGYPSLRGGAWRSAYTNGTGYASLALSCIGGDGASHSSDPADDEDDARR